MDEPHVVDAWLDNKRLERLKDYLERGRPLAEAPTEELNSRWVALMEMWAKTPRAFDHGEREDIEAELQLRKVEPPKELAKASIETLRRQSKEQFDKLIEDPTRFARFEKDLEQDVIEFEAGTKGKKN